MVKIKKISFISLIIMSVYCSSSIAFDLDDLKGLADDMKKNIEETGDALQKDIEDSSKNNQENPEEKSNEPKVAEPKVVEPKVVEPKVAEPKVAEPKVAEPKVAEPKKVIPKKQDVSKKGKDIASKSKTKFKLYSKEDKMTGTKTIYALNTSSDGVGKIETKIYCGEDSSIIKIQFTLFGTAVKKTHKGFLNETYGMGIQRLNKKIKKNYPMERSAEFNNVYNADSIHIKNSQLFACLNDESSIYTCKSKIKGVKLVGIYDLAYSFLTSSGEDYFIDIPPYNPVIQDVIKSCSN